MMMIIIIIIVIIIIIIIKSRGMLIDITVSSERNTSAKFLEKLSKSVLDLNFLNRLSWD